MPRSENREDQTPLVPSFGSSIDPDEIPEYEGEDVYAHREPVSEFEMIDTPPPLRPAEDGRGRARRTRLVAAREDTLEAMPEVMETPQAPEVPPRSARAARQPRAPKEPRQPRAPKEPKVRAPRRERRSRRQEQESPAPAQTDSAFQMPSEVLDASFYGVDPQQLTPMSDPETEQGEPQAYPGVLGEDPFEIKDLPPESEGLAPDPLVVRDLLQEEQDQERASARDEVIPFDADLEDEDAPEPEDVGLETLLGSRRPRPEPQSEPEPDPMPRPAVLPALDSAPLLAPEPQLDPAPIPFWEPDQDPFLMERQDDLETEHRRQQDEDLSGAGSSTLDRVSLSQLNEQGRRRGKRRRIWAIGAGALAAATLTGAVVALPQLSGQSAPVGVSVQDGTSWFTQVPRVENPAEGFPALDGAQAWTMSASQSARSAVFSDGIMVLEGDELKILSIKDGQTQLLRQRLRAAIDYTLQSRTAENVGVISWVSGGTLNSWVSGQPAPSQWKLPTNASVTSPGGGLMVTSDEGVFAAVPGQKSLLEVQVPNGWSAGAVDGSNVVLVNRSAPEVMVVDATNQQGHKVTLEQPFENARVSATVHAGDGIAAVLWSSPAMSNVLTLSIHSLQEGKVLSSVPVLARQASSATLAWNTGQGGQVGYYGPYTFDMQTHQPVSRFSDQENIAGAAGQITWITSNNQNIYQSGGQSWVDSRIIAGMSRDGLIVMRQPDGSLRAVQAR